MRKGGRQGLDDEIRTARLGARRLRRHALRGVSNHFDNHLNDGVPGAWTVSTSGVGTNEGVDSFCLTFTAPVSADKLMYSTTSTDAQNSNSYREARAFGTVLPAQPIAPQRIGASARRLGRSEVRLAQQAWHARASSYRAGHKKDAKSLIDLTS